MYTKGEKNSKLEDKVLETTQIEAQRENRADKLKGTSPPNGLAHMQIKSQQQKKERLGNKNICRNTGWNFPNLMKNINPLNQETQ